MKKIMVLFVVFPVISFAGAFPSWYPKDPPLFIGEIEQLSSTQLSFNDQFFKLSPTVKVSTLTQKNASFSVLKKGDWVGLKMIKFNNKNLVDHIYLRNIKN